MKSAALLLIMFVLSSSKISAFCTIPSLRANDFWSIYRVYMSSSTQSESIGGTGGTPKSRIPRNKNKEKRYEEAREKRRKFIGMAKAVDRGQFAVTYNPRSSESGEFQAKSGLPDRTKLFTVLGVESSCDDTGAAVVRKL